MNKTTLFLLLSITTITSYGADTRPLTDLELELELEDIFSEERVHQAPDIEEDDALYEELRLINQNGDDLVRSASRAFSSLSFENSSKDYHKKRLETLEEKKSGRYSGQAKFIEMQEKHQAQVERKKAAKRIHENRMIANSTKESAYRALERKRSFSEDLVRLKRSATNSRKSISPVDSVRSVSSASSTSTPSLTFLPMPELCEETKAKEMAVEGENE